MTAPADKHEICIESGLFEFCDMPDGSFYIEQFYGKHECAVSTAVHIPADQRQVIAAAMSRAADPSQAGGGEE